MESLNLGVDCRRWFERWEAMQNCYVPQRLYRFDLMLELADLPQDREVRILDLGCGPGSLAQRALQRWPKARAVAVDSDPVLFELGRWMIDETDGRMQFIRADIREDGWWVAYDGVFDLVLSATALHWLSQVHLSETYERIYRILKPGGAFMNSDHFASDDPDLQARQRKELEVKQREAFRREKADDWNGFFAKLAAESTRFALMALRNLDEIWEGTEEGQPRQFHLEALRRAGFERIEFHWEELGDAVLGARKPVEL
ncbi:MAG: class I SAM-dependent methyltransferase [bacterium]